MTELGLLLLIGIAFAVGYALLVRKIALRNLTPEERREMRTGFMAGLGELLRQPTLEERHLSTVPATGPVVFFAGSMAVLVGQMVYDLVRPTWLEVVRLIYLGTGRPTMTASPSSARAALPIWQFTTLAVALIGELRFSHQSGWFFRVLKTGSAVPGSV